MSNLHRETVTAAESERFTVSGFNDRWYINARNHRTVATCNSARMARRIAGLLNAYGAESTADPAPRVGGGWCGDRDCGIPEHNHKPYEVPPAGVFHSEDGAR